MSTPQITWDEPQQSAQVKWDDEQPKPEPGMLDKEIPLTSTGAAWESGLQSIGRGARDAVYGIGNFVAHPVDSLKAIGQIPSQAKQVPAAIHDINQSPDPLGVYAKVGQETAGQGAGQAGVALATEGLARAVPKIASPVASRLYQSALKPSTTLGAERVGSLVQTGLEHGIPVSESGLEKLSGLKEGVDAQIKDVINQNPQRTISSQDVASRLGDTAKKFGNQVNPEADLGAIKQSGDEFLRNQPHQIAGPAAQELKQGTYRVLSGKYGELGSASTEAQKSLARGLKEELANQYPELKQLNATDSRLINLNDALERAVVRHANKEPFGLGGTIAGAATRAATGSSAAGAAAFGVKSLLSDPLLKSRLAIALHAARSLPSGVGAAPSLIGGISRPANDQTP